ncbi:hypothetical protein HNY73_005000 [Argiope bruennichi]|uniref:DUF7041 domain-containing protein n=1 Tax=Argiope bruennichi TaxID=94029 RepID=A0A8T0FQT0_ARGBR|nr:hypothetical protein HNY73_005000 [Argiope bruennichi]
MQNEASGNIARVAVKAPPFWRANPELWFKQIESQFILVGVTTEITKFHHIVSVLQPEELEVVGDIMQDPPAERPYEALRRRLCCQYAQSEEQKLKDVISGMQLGDRKPSRLLIEMRNKAGNKFSEEVLKSLFLQRLPNHVQQILAITNDKLERLAEMADGIMAAATDTVSIQAVSSEASMQATLMEISSRLSRLEARPRSRSRESGRRFHQREANREEGNPSHCWYHQRFKRRAQQCRPPCSFSAEN